MMRVNPSTHKFSQIETLWKYILPRKSRYDVPTSLGQSGVKQATFFNAQRFSNFGCQGQELFVAPGSFDSHVQPETTKTKTGSKLGRYRVGALVALLGCTESAGRDKP